MDKNSKQSKSKAFFKICLYFSLFSLLVLILCIFSQSFAEIYSVTVSEFLRVVIAYLFCIYPFSVSELLIMLIVPASIFCIALMIVLALRKNKNVSTVRLILFSSLMLIFSVFINTFAVCYFRAPLEDNLDVDRKKLTRHELYLNTKLVKDELEKSTDSITFDKSGASVNPHTFEETSMLIDRGYDRLLKDYDFIGSVGVKSKKLLLSNALTYTHISGFYIPFTSEANVNTNYPDYVVAFNIGHEKAHQRGIAGEDDANFVAFLSLMYSGDDYLKYSALMSMYDYFLDAEYTNDKQMYYYFLDNTNEDIMGEMYAYSKFFDKYRDSPAATVADTVNDTYIKVMGNSDGTKSYGKVVELFAAYAKQRT